VSSIFSATTYLGYRLERHEDGSLWVVPEDGLPGWPPPGD
jgi:hypothetical protein